MINEIQKRVLSFPTQLLLIFIGALLFIPQLGNFHLFDWDELMPAESTREMLLTGDFLMVQIDFQPFFEKPPLFFWVQSLSMSWFGVNEIGARMPNVIIGILSMLTVFLVGRHVFRSRLGVLWALLLSASALPQFYFRSGFVHPIYDLLTFLSVFFLYKTTSANDFEPSGKQRSNRGRNLLLSGFFIGLAALAKGPASVVVIVITAVTYFIIHRGKLRMGILDMVLWCMVATAVVFSWLGFELYENGTRFITGLSSFYEKLIGTKAEGHSGPWFYHIIVLLIGLFPSSVLAFDALRKNERDDPNQLNFKRWMIYLFFVNLIIFSLAETKIVHYSSLCYFPITFLAAYYLNNLFENRAIWSWKQTVPVLTVSVLFAVAVTGGVLLMQRKDVFIHYIKDDFAVANLEAPVSWPPFLIYLASGFAGLTVLSIFLIQSKHKKWGVYTLLMSCTIFFNSMLIHVVPRAEQISQAALIAFIKKVSGPGVEIRTAGFKSYAHLFYGKKPLPSGSGQPRKIYVITKINKLAAELSYDHELREVERKNGWVLMVKEPLKPVSATP